MKEASRGAVLTEYLREQRKRSSEFSRWRTGFFVSSVADIPGRLDGIGCSVDSRTKASICRPADAEIYYASLGEDTTVGG